MLDMKVVNIMNFVRKCDFRMEDSEEKLYRMTEAELNLVNEYGLENTFLLQYDALIDERYIRLFRTRATKRTELGLWFEVVKPLTDAVGLPWRGREGTTWDWHVIPGFLMAYTVKERELLVDEAMRKFKEIYGYYPGSVASWLLDSHSAAYLTERYGVSTLGICRDQTNTDAYTLVGGYFNQAYYPSKNNIFTPARSEEYRIKTPVFRLLGPDPIHNYDNDRYIRNQKYLPYCGCYTLEPTWAAGRNPEVIQWFFDTYFRNEDMGYSYAQLGQENNFCEEATLTGLRCQLELLKDYPDVKCMKMRDAGEEFKKRYQKTPATSVCATNDWDGSREVQSVYYDCENYVANLFRYENKIFIRAWYLFDERVYESYYDEPCDTWDATYENLPVIDTILWEDKDGLVLEENAAPFQVKKLQKDVLEVSWGEKAVIFHEEKIVLKNIAASLNPSGSKAKITAKKQRLSYVYKGNHYSLEAVGGRIDEKEGRLWFVPEGEELALTWQLSGSESKIVEKGCAGEDEKRY